MQNSQSSEPIVAQLLEIDTKLATQEVELTLQLQSIQEKRRSLKNVISLFSPVDTATPTTVAVPTPVVEDIAEPPVQEEITLKLDKITTETTAEDIAELPVQEEITTETTEAAPQPPKRQGKRNLSTNSDKPSKKSSPAKETEKESDTWQQYLQDEFVTDSLSVAVFEVMQQHTEQVLEITAILNNIFVDEIPKDIKSKARERVSNVLSVGAKKGKWYRGEPGKYSMSSAAFEDNSIR